MPLNFPENCRQKWDIYDSFADKTQKTSFAKILNLLFYKFFDGLVTSKVT